MAIHYVNEMKADSKMNKMSLVSYCNNVLNIEQNDNIENVRINQIIYRYICGLNHRHVLTLKYAYYVYDLNKIIWNVYTTLLTNHNSGVLMESPNQIRTADRRFCLHFLGVCKHGGLVLKFTGGKNLNTE